MHRTFVLLVALCLGLALPAQNLVQNGSFEERNYCPNNYNLSTINVIKHWSQLNEGTPDYFNACSQKVGVPDNVFGKQPSHSGDGYAGMAIYSPNKRNYREYLTTKLTRPLQNGEMVCIEMYLSPADYSKFVVDGFGLALTKTKPVQDRMNCVMIPTALENPRLNMLDEQNEWLLVSDVYTAKGGEEYLTIGNFHPDRETKTLMRTAETGAKENNQWGYIYIDDVSVKPVKQRMECSCENDVIKTLVHDPPLELSEYDEIQLDAVLFDFDKDELTPVAVRQLEEVYKLLRKNKNMYMVIAGHTDIVGPDGYNLDLSKRRAERVMGYLVAKGIPQDRLTQEYDGSKKPVADNTTEDGRAQNRRVEFMIRKKKFELIN